MQIILMKASHAHVTYYIANNVVDTTKENGKFPCQRWRVHRKIIGECILYNVCINMIL